MKTILSFIFAVTFFSTAFPQAPVITGDLLLCPNTNGTASITTDPGYDTYQWYWKYWFDEEPFVNIPDAENPSFTYDWLTYDQALLKVVVTQGFDTYESNVLQIDSYAWVGLTVGFQDAPNISIDPETGAVNLCEGTGFTIEVYMPYEHVQWYRDGVLIDGANDMQLYVTEAGNYHVVASPAFCPDSTSSTAGLPIVVQIVSGCGLSVDDHHGLEIGFYPNPVKDVLTLSTSAPLESITIYNIAGQCVQKSANASQIDISALASGMYFLEAKSGGNTAKAKVVKQ
jgi:hypothetical protein